MSYIGEKEVSSIDGTIVTFVDNTTETFTQKNLTYLVTDEPTDATAFLALYVDNTSSEAIEYLKSNDLFDNSPENLEKIQKGMLDIFETHDLPIGDLREPAALDGVMQNVTLAYFKTFNDLGKYIGYTMQDTFNDAIVSSFQVGDRTIATGTRIRKIRISDLKKARNIT